MPDQIEEIMIRYGVDPVERWGASPSLSTGQVYAMLNEAYCLGLADGRVDRK